MATVYDVHIGTFQKKPSATDGSVMSVEVSLILIDGDESDEWISTRTTTAVLGEGSGLWVRNASTNTIEFRDDDGSTRLAQLTYSSWPMRYADFGKIRLLKPLKGGSARTSRGVDFDYSVGHVR